LIELIVVIGIIIILLALLLPVLHAARKQANTVACQSNLHQIGIAFQIYGNTYGGWVFPPSNSGVKVSQWATVVFKSADPNPPFLICPADVEPKKNISYILNDHIRANRIRFGSKPPGRTPSEAVVMGEKRSGSGDYLMSVNYPELADYLPDIGPYTDYYDGDVVEEWRHGTRPRTGGSNYLFLDLHVERKAPWTAPDAHDPWGFALPTNAP
jgi:prepilin-type processing-associated H-X9-DG protein